MGMGYGANCADVLDVQVIKNECPKEWKAFEQALKDNNLSLEEFAEILNNGDFDDKEGQLVYDLFVKLQEAMEKRTGIVLLLCHHNTDDNGDRYDDVDGAFWHVENLYQKNPILERFYEQIERKWYVTFG